MLRCSPSICKTRSFAWGITPKPSHLPPGDQCPALDVETLGPSRYHPKTIQALRDRMTAADVTVGHGSDTLMACATAGIGPGRPFVYRQISDTRFWTKGWTRRLRVAALMRSASQVVALSETDRTDLREHLRLADSRITVIPNGVPIDGFAPATPEQRVAAKADFDVEREAFVLLSMSALVPEKGVDVAIRATSALEGCHLLVVGDGPERASLERLAADVAPGRVTFTGALSEPLEAYRAADVVLLPSLGGDTMPATLIEAGLCGLPSVATPIGAIEEIVLDRRTGFIVPPGDDGAVADGGGDPATRSRPRRCNGAIRAAPLRRHVRNRSSRRTVGRHHVGCDHSGKAMTTCV